jgi:GT2 family glycosyltransferase
MSPLAPLRGVLRAVRALGLRGVVEREIRRARDRRDYARWVGERERAEASGARVEVGAAHPFFSVLVPTHETDPRWLERSLESVRAQAYPRWELCVADDASASPEVAGRVEALARVEPRVKLVRRPVRGHISAASNSALGLASGEFVALLDHDDELAPDALARVADEIVRCPEADLVYSDEDKIDARGRRVDAYFKPDFSPDLLLSQNLVSHLGVYRTGLVRQVGGFRDGLEGSQDHDLALRVLERSSPGQVRHVPHVLYHWRTTPRSTSGGLWRKDYAHDAGRRAIAEHLVRTGRPGDVERSLFAYYRVRYTLPDPPPSVAVVAREPLVPRLERLLAAAHPEAQLTRVATGAPGTLAARLAAALRGSRGDIVVLLGPAAEPEPRWLEELVSQAARPEIGVVGGRVLSRSRRVHHAGYLLCLDRDPPVVDAHRGLPAAAPGHFGRANLVQNLCAVSVESLAVRRELFDALGGFDARSFPGGLFDVDLCLRAREAGLRVLFTPHATVVRRGGMEADPQRLGSPAERERLRAAWGDRLERDPYWHPAMDRASPDLRLLV